MFEELFNSLYAPIPNAAPYLERIGVEGDVKPDKTSLDRLIYAHQTAVPFENLDIYDADREIPIGIEALYDKVVTRRRGGYCYELNAVFMALLQAVGFNCSAVSVRVVRDNSMLMPLTHRATVVKIGGESLFCDVGFGGPSPRGSLRLDYDGEQAIGPDIFRLTYTEHGTVINRLTESGLEKLLMFSEIPVDPVDFLACNFYQSKFPGSYFRMTRLVNLNTRNGSVSLTGNSLKIRDGESLIEKTLKNEDELKAALRDYFGIVVDYALKV